MKLPHIPAKEEGPVRGAYGVPRQYMPLPAAEGILRSIVSSHNADNDWVIDSAEPTADIQATCPTAECAYTPPAEATISPTAHAGSHRATSATST